MSRGYDEELEEHPENDPSRPFVAPFAIGFVVLLLALLVGSLWRAFAEPLPSGDTFTGQAVIVDGDTLDIGSTRIRLTGIDAPEAGQKCNEAGGGNWPCGNEAIKAITGITAGKQVTCHGSGLDDYGRTLAVCSVGSVEINREMVRRGLAWNFDKYSMDYKSDEEQARQAHTGVFQAVTTTPWDYRAERWNFALQEAPNGCPIKGNINTKGEKIYHAPWSPWYKRTKVSLDQGEHWFCDEGAAIKAGWRAPYWN